jgi:sec-independent protein translocase protein TatB
VFGISAPEFIVLLAVAAVVLGPDRMPQYAQQLGRLVRELRRMAQGASQQVRSEMGPEFDDIDWRKFDPRQYDPRRIVRDALSDTFDPDDPLGLRDLDGKPVNPGGPQAWGTSDDRAVQDDDDTPAGAPAGRVSRNGTGAEPADTPAVDRGPDRAAPPPFDTDAT